MPEFLYSTHIHITTWALGLILFFVGLGLHNSGNTKGLKVVHMILRLVYLLIILTGGLLFSVVSNFTFTYVLKALLGLWVISMLEMILVRKTKGKSTKIFWVQLIIALILVIYLGLRLPLGFHPFL